MSKRYVTSCITFSNVSSTLPHFPIHNFLSFSLFLQIKEEFLRRKNLREAKAKLNSAIVDANRIKSAEEIAKEVKEANERRIAEEAAAEKKKMLDELAARAARKAALNAKWGGGGPKADN